MGRPCSHQVISGIVVSANNSFLQKITVFDIEILWFWRRAFISIIVSITNEKLKLEMTLGRIMQHRSLP